MSSVLASLLIALGPALGSQSQELPFQRLGDALLAETSGSQEPIAALDRLERELLARLAPLHAAVDLGAFELWIPLRAMDEQGELAEVLFPREWKTMAEDLLALEQRWCAALGELDPKRGASTAEALAGLSEWVRRTGAKHRPLSDGAIHLQARALRTALLGASDAAPLVILIAPQRAQLLALIGAAGVLAPGQRSTLWNENARRCLGQVLGPTLVALALSFGPRHESDSPFLGQPLDQLTLHQNVVHAASHLLCNRLATTAPNWLHEGVALGDTHALCGADDTLCSGYSGRPRSIFEDLREVPQAFLIFTRAESSPYRTGASAGLFRDALRSAHEPDGFRVLDLDRGVAGLVAPGPFLGATALVPEEVRIGPQGLKEGFAEFFRAYCGAFVAWLATPRGAGPSWLDGALRELRARALKGTKAPPAELHAILRGITSLALGESLDAELDLEAQFQAWLSARR
jgi:hypothetical protein